MFLQEKIEIIIKKKIVFRRFILKNFKRRKRKLDTNEVKKVQHKNKSQKRKVDKSVLKKIN